MILVVGTAAITCGCAAIDTTGAANSELPAIATAAQPAPASITVEIRPAGKKAEMRQMPLTNGMRIQEALEQLGLVKRFRRMRILVMRAASGQRHKLEVKYDHTAHAVDPLYDYALHPGDHLVVIQDTATFIDDMLQNLTGPIGQAIGR